MNPDLLILCATLPEAAGFFSWFDPKPHTVFSTGPVLFAGKSEKRTWALLISGPGVFNTVHALTLCLEKHACSMIVDTGIAGVFRGTGLNIGDIAVATQEQYVHCGVAECDLPYPPLPFDLISSLPSSRYGRYPFDPDRVDRYVDVLARRMADTAGGIRVKKGLFLTVSAITATQSRAKRLHAAFSALMESMEGAAAAHIAALYRIPMLEIRAASNFVGDRDHADWDKDRAVRGLEKALAGLYPGPGAPA